jgi:hypothetical protein
MGVTSFGGGVGGGSEEGYSIYRETPRTPLLGIDFTCRAFRYYFGKVISFLSLVKPPW